MLPQQAFSSKKTFFSKILLKGMIRVTKSVWLHRNIKIFVNKCCLGQKEEWHLSLQSSHFTNLVLQAFWAKKVFVAWVSCTRYDISGYSVEACNDYITLALTTKTVFKPYKQNKANKQKSMAWKGQNHYWFNHRFPEKWFEYFTY